MDEEHKTDRNKQTIGEFIQARREAHGISRPEAASQADIDPSYWRRIEAGERKEPNPQVLRRIADVIDCPVEDLYALVGYEPASQLPSFQPYLRSKYHLPPEAIDQLEGYFAFLRSQYGIPDDQPVYPAKDRTDTTDEDQPADRPRRAA